MIPILTFHSLAAGSDVIDFAPDSFARACQRWHAAGWRTISLTELAQCLREQSPFPPRTFVLTFDDGYASVYRVAFPILQEYAWTATVFIPPGERAPTQGTAGLPQLYNREMLRWNQIREMHAYGITFGAHTLTHCDLTQAGAADAEREMHLSQSRIADALGEPVTLFAYPFGHFNPTVRAIAQNYFDAAVSDHLGLVNTDSDLFTLARVETYYLQSDWAADGVTREWFPLYLGARNVPRRARRALQNLIAF